MLLLDCSYWIMPSSGGSTMPTQHRFRGNIAHRTVFSTKSRAMVSRLLLLHGLMVTGAMFDPLVVLLQKQFSHDHSRSSRQGRAVTFPGRTTFRRSANLRPLEHAGFENCAVLGYSHGGAVLELAHTHQALVNKMMLTCTYAYNVATARERMEASVFLTLLTLFTPRTLANLVVQPSNSNRPTKSV